MRLIKVSQPGEKGTEEEQGMIQRWAQEKRLGGVSPLLVGVPIRHLRRGSARREEAAVSAPLQSPA